MPLLGTIRPVEPRFEMLGLDVDTGNWSKKEKAQRLPGFSCVMIRL